VNTKLLLAIATAVGISGVAATAIAAPLPAGTKLTITGTTDAPGLVPCTNGSCFGMFLAPGLFYWMPLHPGTDGGLILGKAQKSGGQELDALSSADGEVTAVWNYGANWGTFFTAPSDAGNVFDDQSCTGSGCGSRYTPRLTDLYVWNTAWNKIVIPLGRNATKCSSTSDYVPGCTTDQLAGIHVRTWTIDPAGTSPRKYRLTYWQIASAGFPNFPFELILAGEVVKGNAPPIVTVVPPNITGTYSAIPLNFTITATDADGDPLTCRVGTPPANGVVVLNNCASGTYTADWGFLGTNSFTIIANDGKTDSDPFLVNVAIFHISATYTSTFTRAPTVTFTPTPTNTPTIAPSFSIHPTATYTPTTTPIITECSDRYPLIQATLTGKQGHLTMTVTGNIISVNPNGKEIKICPTTTASYNARTNNPLATVVCRVKSNTTRGNGQVKVNDHIKCTDKPVGNDKLNVKIKSGVHQKAM
jgi:hypothetical protein